MRLVRAGALGAMAILVILLCAEIVTRGDEVSWKAIGVFAVLYVLGTLLLPLVRIATRSSESPPPVAPSPVPAAAGAPSAVRLDAAIEDLCGRGFEIVAAAGADARRSRTGPRRIPPRSGRQAARTDRLLRSTDAGSPGYREGTMAESLRIDERLSIPLAEIELRTSRSSGPGGQHANVTASRVEAVFDVEASRALDERAAGSRWSGGRDR